MTLPIRPKKATVTVVTEGRGGFAFRGRYYSYRTKSWETRTARDPQPPPREPRITGGGTPRELALKAISEGKYRLAGEYMLQAESEHGIT